MKCSSNKNTVDQTAPGTRFTPSNLPIDHHLIGVLHRAFERARPTWAFCGFTASGLTR